MLDLPPPKKGLVFLNSHFSEVFFSFLGIMDARDIAYQQARDFLERRRLSIACGGDSHGSKLAFKLGTELGFRRTSGMHILRVRGNLRHFAIGGATVARYRNSGLFGRLLACRAPVTLITIGGNDLDATPVLEAQRYVTKRRVLQDVMSLIRDLENHGKVVYFLEIPTRFSCRERGSFHELRDDIKYVNRTLRKLIKGRYINIPGRLFSEGRDAFERSNRRGHNVSEYVHYRDGGYRRIARQVIEQIVTDLSTGRTPPSRMKLHVSEDFPN